MSVFERFGIRNPIFHFRGREYLKGKHKLNTKGFQFKKILCLIEDNTERDFELFDIKKARSMNDRAFFTP